MRQYIVSRTMAIYAHQTPVHHAVSDCNHAVISEHCHHKLEEMYSSDKEKLAHNQSKLGGCKEEERRIRDQVRYTSAPFLLERRERTGRGQ